PVYKEVFRKIKVDIDLLYISERNYQVEHMLDLLYLTEGEENLNDQKNTNDIPEGLKTHYVFITDFTRLMHLLEKHIPTCPGPTEQKAISYEYTIHCSDGTTQKPVINQESENIIKDLMENLQEDLEICEEKLHKAGYNKIRVFNAETKKYLGTSHRKCHGKKSMIQGKLDDEQKEKHKSCK
ncbi:14724_t:CDS:2, partial [Racocetra persica]